MGSALKACRSTSTAPTYGPDGRGARHYRLERSYTLCGRICLAKGCRFSGISSVCIRGQVESKLKVWIR